VVRRLGLVVGLVAMLASPAIAQTTTGTTSLQLPDLTSRENFSAAMQIIVLLTILSLAPAIMIMMTSFTRIIIVLSLLRQALGTPQLPPNQVIIGLALFMTFLVMGPTFDAVHSQAIRPYLDGSITQTEALRLAEGPVREFMIRQIEATNNDEDVLLFHGFTGKPPPQTWADVSTMTLIPSFMLSELKTAFLIGFKIYLPFLIIDMVISAVLISMGMMMLPPVLISLPFKLLLFVLVDGWRLITASLMSSFAVGSPAG
jgi:flagellar biosynthetic protein FliP